MTMIRGMCRHYAGSWPCVLPATNEVKHLGLANKRGRRDQALEHLARVNGWTAKHTSRYLNAQFALSEERSRHEWELDISRLMQAFPDLAPVASGFG
jgi:hypothetical protein